MKVFIATDFNITKVNNRYYFGSALSSIIERYFNAFGELIICTRVDENAEINSQQQDVTDMIQKVVEVKDLARAFLKRTNDDMLKEIKECDLVIARIPSIIAYRAVDCAKELNKPVFTEVMGCAWDAYWNHGVAGKIIAPYMFYKMRSIVRNADFALYVTEKFLQTRYPCNNRVVSASNVKINDATDEILSNRIYKINHNNERVLKVMTSAAVDVKYKGQEYMIRAIPLLNRKGISVEYYLAGDGNQTYLRTIAKKAGVENQVFFLGRLALDEVFEKLKEIDIYVQPSLQEGLPRAMIEAMSMGCPCIGARTAGIPELISETCVVKRKSYMGLYRKTISLFCSKKTMVQEASNNFRKAKEYGDVILSKRREEYYEYIKSNIV